MIVIFEVEHRAVYTLVSIAPGAGGSQRRDINQILGKQFRTGIEFQIIKIPRLLMQELHQFVVHRRTNRQALARPRSAERREGNECVSTGRSWGSPYQ